MKNITMFMIIFCCLEVYTLHAQNSRISFIDSSVKKNGINSFSTLHPEEVKSSEENEIRLLRQITKATTNSRFKLVRQFGDKYGYQHKVYQQYYNNILVDGSTVGIHIDKKGFIRFVNGHSGNFQYLVLKQKINSNAAGENAKTEFIKRNTSKVSRLTKDNLQTENMGEVIAKAIYINDTAYKLAHKIKVSINNDNRGEILFIDAITGNLISSQSLACNYASLIPKDVNVNLRKLNATPYYKLTKTSFSVESNPSTFSPPNATGSGVTLYSGTQTITTDAIGGQFRLAELRNGVSITTRSANHTSTYAFVIPLEIYDNDNFYGASEHGSNREALDVHWGAEKVYDYWLNVHGRNSLDGAGGTIHSYIHWGLNDVAASWDPVSQGSYYGDGDGSDYNPIASIGVVAHETGHGVCQYTSNLSHTNSEEGTLNEGFSEIWAAAVKAYISKPNIWLTGEEYRLSSPYFDRSMADPNSGPMARCDTYGGTYWDSGNDPYANMGVFTHWFYLLVQGGTGTNDNSNSYKVHGIGMSSAEQIAFETELLMQNGDGFSDARTNSIAASTIVLGSSCTREKLALKEAWYAVGVGGSPFASTTISGTTPICTSESYSISGLPGGATNINWSQLPGGNATLGSPTTTNPITVSKAYEGSSTIYATYINGGECLGTPDKIIVLGAPYTITKTIVECVGTVSTQFLQVVPATGSGYSWTVNFLTSGSSISIQSPSSSGTNIFVQGGGTVTCSFTDACGASRDGGPTVWSTCYGFRMSASPNPAKNNVNVSILDEGSTNHKSTDPPAIKTSQIRSDGKTILSLYELNTGKLIKQWKHNEASTRTYNLNIAGMRKGLYVLQVDRNNSTMQTKIIVD